MVRRVKIHGERGRWVAEVEGQWLAVVHHTQRVGLDKHFQPFDRGDPRGLKRYDEFEDALKTRDLVVVQRDRDATSLARDGYVGVFRFSNLVIDYEDGVRFDYVRKCADPANP